MEYPLGQSSWSRAKQDTISAQKTVRFMWGGEGVLAVAGGTWLVQIAPLSTSALEIVVRSVVGGLGGLLTAILIIFAWNLFQAPYRQRNEVRKALVSIPEATSNSPIIAKPHLNFDKVNYRFEKARDNIQVIADMMMSATGIMKVEDVNLVISGQPILCERWIVREVGMGYTLPTVRFILVNKLATGEHEVSMKAYANGQWWASSPSTINYDPSILDKADSQN